MESLFILVLLAGVIVVVVGAIMGMVAKSQGNALRERVTWLERDMARLRTQLRAAPPAPDPPARPVAAPEPAISATTPQPAPAPPPLPAVRVAPPPEPPIPVEFIHRPAPTPPPAEPVTAAAPTQPEPPTTADIASVEAAVGLRWMTWVGVALLFLGVAFFLKYAYDRDWLGHLFGPRLRIATATLAAASLAFAGWRCLGRGMTALGQGLLGGGQAMLYLTIFAAFQPALLVVQTPLIGATTAFILLATVTAAGLAAAVRLDSAAMAFIAVLGGIATPLLVGSGGDARDILFAYLLLLDLGVLGVALHRRWRALDLLAFAGTVLLFGCWFATWHRHHAQPDVPTLAWLGAFHLVFLLLPFAHHWRTRSAVTVERFAIALGNLAWTLGYAAWMLHDPAPRLLAAGCLAGAALYLGLGLATLRRIGDDVRTRDGFLALAAALLTLGLFYLLPVDGITTAWFAEAAALLWLGYRFAHAPTRWAALAVLALAMARSIICHLPAGEPSAPLLFNSWFATVAVASAGLAAFAVIHRRHGAAGGERLLPRLCGTAAVLWFLLIGSLEILRHADGHASAWGALPTAMAIAWLQLAGVIAFLTWAVRRMDAVALITALLPLAAAAVAAAVAYGSYPAEALPVLNGCCVSGLLVCGALLLAAALARRLLRDPDSGAALYGLAQLALLALATTEALAWLQRGAAAPAATDFGLTLGWTWILAAAAGSVVALARRSRRVLHLAVLPLVLACLATLWLFCCEPTHQLLANPRFLLAVACCMAVAWMGTVSRRIAEPAVGAEHGATPGTALALLLVYATCEAVAWGHGAAWSTWLIGAAAVLAALGGLWRWRTTANRSLRAVAGIALAGGLVLPLLVYDTGWSADLMFLNLRFALVGAGVATALLWAGCDAGLRWLRWVSLAVALLGLSAEPPAWLLDHVADPAEAARSALFSVTVVWVVIAGSLLVAGLRRDHRPLRLVALALFALTAAKLLLLDMSGAQQLYRILAFVLVGLVFVGASWLYHRLAGRMAGPSGTDAAMSGPPGRG